VNPKPDHRRPREEFRYFPGGAQVPESVAVNVRNRSHALIVDVGIADPGRTDGVLLAMGSALGGWSLHILGAKIRYVHNLYGKQRDTIESGETITPGEHHITAPFPFSGTIHRAVVETRGPVLRDPLAELEAILSEQ